MHRIAAGLRVCSLVWVAPARLSRHHPCASTCLAVFADRAQQPRQKREPVRRLHCSNLYVAMVFRFEKMHVLKRRDVTPSTNVMLALRHFFIVHAQLNYQLDNVVSTNNDICVEMGTQK